MADWPVNFEFTLPGRRVRAGTSLIAVDKEVIFTPFRINLNEFVETYVLFVVSFLSDDIYKIIRVVGGLRVKEPKWLNFQKKKC